MALAVFHGLQLGSKLSIACKLLFTSQLRVWHLLIIIIILPILSNFALVLVLVLVLVLLVG